MFLLQCDSLVLRRLHFYELSPDNLLIDYYYFCFTDEETKAQKPKVQFSMVEP